MYSQGFTNNTAAVALFQDTERDCDKQRTAGITVKSKTSLSFNTYDFPLSSESIPFRSGLSKSAVAQGNLFGPTRPNVYNNDIPNICDDKNALATHTDGMNVGVLSGSLLIPISKRNKAMAPLEPGSRNGE
jgi:hypothetical protein